MKTYVNIVNRKINGVGRWRDIVRWNSIVSFSLHIFIFSFNEKHNLIRSYKLGLTWYQSACPKLIYFCKKLLFLAIFFVLYLSASILLKRWNGAASVFVLLNALMLCAYCSCKLCEKYGWVRKPYILRWMEHWLSIDLSALSPKVFKMKIWEQLWYHHENAKNLLFMRSSIIEWSTQSLH